MLFVSIVFILTIIGLICDWMRPGLLLLSAAILLMVAGKITSEDLLLGFSNKGMVTVAMLFLISEGIRRSGVLSFFVNKILPQRKISYKHSAVLIYPFITSISAFLNNTPIVVIFAPMIKQWANKYHLSVKKYLIPLSYATILGGMCSLIGSSTNLVVDGLMQENGIAGFSMFEISKIGVFIAISGLFYLIVIAEKILPKDKGHLDYQDSFEPKAANMIEIEVLLGPRFPGIGKTLSQFDFKRHYGAEVLGLRRNEKQLLGKEANSILLKERDVLMIEADRSFIDTWGESSVFVLLFDLDSILQKEKKNKRIGLCFLLLLFLGALFSETTLSKTLIPGVPMDMFFFVSIITVLMAWTKVFPARKYTKYISWDILITIASAFALSKAIQNCGLADLLGQKIIASSQFLGPQGCILALFLFTNLITELITNNAAVALSFPIALAISEQLGADTTPFLITICIAASSSFLTPIGYQTNMIVQGLGAYRFMDFVKTGFPLTLISLLLSVILVPYIWPIYK